MSEQGASISQAGAGPVSPGGGGVWLVAVWVLALVAAVILFAANLLFGDLNADEGWYLYAARLVSEGKLPYVDFASTQGPVMPAVYAAAYPLVARWGVAGGRLFTGLLGLVSALGAGWLAARHAPRATRRAAAAMGFVLVGVNVYQSYFTTVVKTYALTALLMVLGFVVLTWRGGRRGWLAVLGAGVLLGLAAATRSSAALALPVVFGVLVVSGWRGPRVGRLHALWFGVGAAATLGAAFLPFVVRAPAGVWFALVEYHAGRQVGGLLQAAAYKAGFVSRTVGAYFPVVALGCAAVLWGLARRGRERGADGPGGGTVVLWASAAAVTLIHWLAPFPYDDYQAIVHPLLGAALGVALARAAGELRGVGGGPLRGAQAGMAWLVLLVCTASAFSSPINQSWFIGARDRIWWPMKTETPLANLQRAGRLARELADGGDTVLTQDAYLAVEAGLRVPDGLELGPFSYFPDWPRDKCERLHVLNREMMHELLASTGAAVVATSGYSLTIRSPSVTELPAAERALLRGLIEQRYTLREELSGFGQAGTVLRLYVPLP